VKFIVEDCTKQGDLHLHQGQLLKGQIEVGEVLNTSVDASLRQSSTLNHSATHLLHQALRQVIGDHVQQKGSLVDPQKLRFDFSHFEAVTVAQVAEVEEIVNLQIMANTPVVTAKMDIASAKALGAQALFGEKYSERVRVVTMGSNSFSIELCGGTHVRRTGDIALLKIKSECGIASGVRRIEAVTGQGALDYVLNIVHLLAIIAVIV
jgi:alanyl-tRNA synthetase